MTGGSKVSFSNGTLAVHFFENTGSEPTISGSSRLRCLNSKRTVRSPATITAFTSVHMLR
ncbi:hypothetical protein D3C72_2059190 [compost metagenome]